MSTWRERERTIPVRTLLLAAAVAMLAAAVISIKDTLILVFLGIFLALVFEIPLRAFVRWTKWGRGSRRRSSCSARRPRLRCSGSSARPAR